MRSFQHKKAKHEAPHLVQTSEVRKAATKKADDYKLILREFARDPFSVATVCPSSPFLARHLANSLALETAKVVVELGPGTGALTEAVLPRMHPQARFLAVERNPALCAAWRHRYPRHTVVEGSVADLPQICADQGIEAVDCVISGLPWPSFDAELQQAGLSGVHQVLSPGGQMAAFGYHFGLLMPGNQRYYKLLGHYFSSVERLSWEWRNLPPAFVTRCTK
jgi:phosphatidylethanolamine/phosphatidyl-N-methylethanolamine N-methyltransferase